MEQPLSKQAVRQTPFYERPDRLSPKAEKVMEVMIRDGGITHLVATHYNVGDVRREISRIRAAMPVNYKIKTVRTRKDVNGNAYTRWTVKAA